MSRPITELLIINEDKNPVGIIAVDPIYQFAPVPIGKNVLEVIAGIKSGVQPGDPGEKEKTEQPAETSNDAEQKDNNGEGEAKTGENGTNQKPGAGIAD